MYIYTCIFIHIWAYVYMYAYTYTQMCEDVHIPMYTYIYYTNISFTHTHTHMADRALKESAGLEKDGDDDNKFATLRAWLTKGTDDGVLARQVLSVYIYIL